MSRAAPSNLRSLNARLRNLARDRGVPEGRVRRLIGIVVIGQLLAQGDLAVIKGASNIEDRGAHFRAWLEDPNRRIRAFATRALEVFEWAAVKERQQAEELDEKL